jgi:hypothetical protein
MSTGTEEVEQNVAAQGGVVASMTLLSRISGLLRDMVLSYFLGAQGVADAFFVAFRIPNFFRRLFAEGAFRMITGQVNKATGAAVQVHTPVAALSVRGTDFWSGPIDGGFGVFLINGEVHVRTVGGETTLSEPNTGTNIANAASAPGPVTIWPQDKVSRALAAVAFQ